MKGALWSQSHFPWSSRRANCADQTLPEKKNFAWPRRGQMYSDGRVLQGRGAQARQCLISPGFIRKGLGAGSFRISFCCPNHGTRRPSWGQAGIRHWAGPGFRLDERASGIPCWPVDPAEPSKRRTARQWPRVYLPVIVLRCNDRTPRYLATPAFPATRLPQRVGSGRSRPTTATRQIRS